MANMITRPIANAIQRALATTYLWGHTGTGPATDLRIAMSDMVFRDASGNYLMGAASHSITNQSGISFEPQVSGVSNQIIGHANGTTSGNPYIRFTYNGTQIASIAQNGTTGVTFNTTSDERVKKNIARVESDASGQIIDQIEIVSHDWRRDDTHVPFGVIAQKLHKLYPLAVTEGDETPLYTDAKTGTKQFDEAGKGRVLREDAEMWGVDYSKLVPLMMAELKSLRARLAELESPTS